MGNYVSVGNAKKWLDIKEGVDDNLLGEAIAAAEQYIDTATNLRFRVPEVTWRRFHAVDDVADGILYFDKHLIKDSQIINGDGSIIPVASRFLIPTNEPPYWAMQLAPTLAWTFTLTPIEAIRILGYWGYSRKAPRDIVQAARRLAMYLYKQRGSQVFEVASFREGGIMIIPEGVPAFVQKVIDKYHKVAIA